MTSSKKHIENKADTSFVSSRFKNILKNTVCIVGVTTVALTSLANASENTTNNLGDALQSFAQQNNIRILFRSDLVAGKSAKAVSKNASTKEYLEQLLAGTGLGYEIDPDGNIYINDQSSIASKAGYETVSLNSSAYYESNLEKLSAEIDDSEEGEVATFDEIIVTSSRREQALQDVPSSITTVNTEQFKDAGFLSIDDVIAYTPGFNVVNEGQRGTGSISARGVGQQSSTSVVAIYIDDVPMTGNGPFAAGGNLFFDGLLGDLERVELLRGPQGTLFGATAIGGAIRYISKKPSLDEIRGNVSANISTTKDGGFNQLYSGRVSLPLIEDKIGITVAGFYEDNNGFVDLVDPATGNVVEEDIDHGQTYGFSGDLYLQASENFEIRLKAFHQNIQFNGLSLVDLAGTNFAPLYAPLTNDDALTESAYNFTVFSGSMDYDFEWATLTSTSSYTKYRSDSVNDLTADFAFFVDAILEGNPPGTTTSVPFIADLASEKFVQEVRLTSSDSDEFEWILGLYFADEDTYNIQEAVSQPTGFNLITLNFPSTYREYAAFGNLTYYVTPDFDLTAGIRYSDTSMGLDQISSGALIGPGVAIETVDDTVSTFLFTARYRPNENMSLWARVSSGYRPAAANLPLLDPVTGLNTAPALIEQDSLWSYEVGAKGTTNEGIFSYDFALWYLKWNNFQSFVTLNGVTVAGNAVPDVTAKGFEGTFNLNPTDNLLISSTVAYTDSTLDADDPGIHGLAGARIPDVPKWTATLTGRYDFDISDDMTGHVGGGLRYTDSTLSAFVDGAPGEQTVLLTTDDYVVVDLNAGISWDQVSLNLYITNLLNDDSYTAASGTLIPGTTLVNAQTSPLRPRTIGAVLSFDF